MAPATKSMTMNQVCKDVLNVHSGPSNYSVMAEILGKSKGSKLTRVSPAEIDVLKQNIAKFSTNGNGPTGDKPDEPKAKAKKQGKAVRPHRDRRLGAYGRVQRLRRPRIQLTMEDRVILDRLERALKNIDTVIPAAATRPPVGPRNGELGVRDAVYPDNPRLITWMKLPEYWSAKERDELPLLHRDSKRELANELARLSFASPECTLCRGKAGPIKQKPIAKIELLLAKKFKLPFDPNARDVIKFWTSHKRCEMIQDLMVGVELEPEIQAMPEDSVKGAARVSRYIARLDEPGENGNTLWSALMDVPGEGHMSAKEVNDLIKTIYATMLDEKEELA